MTYLCPLCFVDLDASQTLEVRCTAHPADALLVTGLSTVPEWRCSQGCDPGPGPISMMCRHVGCEVGINPFWNAVRHRVVVDDQLTPEVQRPRRVLPGSASLVTAPAAVKVAHWQIDALRVFEKIVPGAREMWFPVDLLVPVDRSVRAQGHMRLVALAGARSVGKTYHALHVLDDEGGSRPRQHFLYCLPPQGGDTTVAAREFLETIHLRNLMRDNKAFSAQLRGTRMHPRNLKAAFLALGPVTRPSPLRRLVGLLKEAATVARFRALLLYDIAGEALTQNPAVLAEHYQRVDVVAVFVSAEDLNGGGTGSSLTDALAHLEQVARVKARDTPARCALVVTKADQATTAGTWTAAGVRSMVQASITARHEMGTLAAYLTDQTIDEVFVVHPDNDAIDAPKIVGLPEFVDWCYG